MHAAKARFLSKSHIYVAVLHQVWICILLYSYRTLLALALADTIIHSVSKECRTILHL